MSEVAAASAAAGPEWASLRELSPVFCGRVAEVFLHVGNFCLAAATAEDEDVHEIVDETMSDVLSVEDRSNLAEAVFSWCQRHQCMVERTVRHVADRVLRGLTSAECQRRRLGKCTRVCLLLTRPLGWQRLRRS